MIGIHKGGETISAEQASKFPGLWFSINASGLAVDVCPTDGALSLLGMKQC